MYYPDASNLTVDRLSGELDSLEACRVWIDDEKSTYNPNGARDDDYECCKNGKYNPDWDMYVCDDTVR